MVLQQAPAAAAVYGFLEPGATGVTVTISSGGHDLYTVEAKINATQQPFGPGFGPRPCDKANCPPYNMEPFRPFNFPLPTWKALLRPTPAETNGTVFSVRAVCVGCTSGNATLTLSNVVFGDVWYCSGQSNMWLSVHNTFTRNISATNIHQYANIRLMDGSSGSVPYAKWPPSYGHAGGSNPWLTAAEAAPAGCVATQSCPLFVVGATCWYALAALADAGVNTPLGLIDTAIGGQRIEEFMVNTTVAECSHLLGSNIPWWNGQLYGQQVLPFVDMSVKGWLWYQGENNMGGTKGNALAGVGYSCAMEQLVRGWRSVWSQTPGTTDPVAPFGIVTLASSGSEGGPNMGAMRWAQTGSYGVLPSLALPATFIAQAYDLDDEWGPALGPCFASAWQGHPGWACCKPGYNATLCNGRETKCEPACAAAAGTPSLGGIHPRSKAHVGNRLGRAAFNSVYGGSGSVTGPTLASCAVAGTQLTIEFNRTLLRGDSLALQSIASAGGSQLWVQTNASLFCMEPQCVVNATTGACETIDPSKPRSPIAEFCAPYSGGDGTTVQPRGVFDSGWTQLNFTAASSASIVVDLTPLAGRAPTAVRYAWGILNCCDLSDPTLYVSHGCIAGCPIMASSGLPANPFQARIVDGVCSCVAPQVC